VSRLRFGTFLASAAIGVTGISQVDRAVLERYLADLHAGLAGTKVHREHIGQLSAFLQAIRQHRWDDRLPATAMFMVIPQRINTTTYFSLLGGIIQTGCSCSPLMR
jgi:hypothetical protein